MRTTEKQPTTLHLQSLKALRTKWHQISPSDPREPKEKAYIMARLLDEHFWHFGESNTQETLLRMMNSRLLEAFRTDKSDIDRDELWEEVKNVLHLVEIMYEAQRAHDLTRAHLREAYPESYRD